MGWIANVCLISGIASLGRNRRWPFLCTAAGELIWIALGIARHEADITAVSVVFMALSIRNFIRWERS